MPSVYGSASHGPEQVMKHLIGSQGLHPSQHFTILPLGAQLNPDRAHKYKQVILILSAQDFLRNHLIISEGDLNDKVYYVFAPAFRLNEFKGIIPIDYLPDEVNPDCVFELMEGFIHYHYGKSDVNITRSNKSYLDRLLKSVEKNSLLAVFMTYIYTLPSSTHQKPITSAVCKWIYEGLSVDDLEKTIDLFAKVSVAPKIMSNLERILFTPLVDMFREAFSEYRMRVQLKEPASISDIAKEFGVPKYEMSYIRAKYLQDIEGREQVVQEKIANQGV